MDTIECVICLNDISNNNHFTLTCCKNNVHIYCLNYWIQKNITKKNISKCFICSQENTILQDIVSYNSPLPNVNCNSNTNSSNIIDNSANTIIDNSSNNINDNSASNINEIIIHSDNNFTTIAYNVDKSLYFLYIFIKLCFLISVLSLSVFVLYYLI